MDEIRQLNQQIAFIAQVAREYANATPEQREKIDPRLVQETIQQYNDLKARRDALYTEQEIRVQNELNQKRAEAQAAQRAVQGTGRRVPKTPIVETIKQTEPINVAITEQGEVVPVTEVTPTNNGNYYIGPITGMKIRKPFTIGGKPIGNYNRGTSILPEGFVLKHGGPTGESILGGNNIYEVSMGGNGTGEVVNITPTNEQFRVAQVINGHTYEYGDNGSVKIDGVLQRAGNGTDYIVQETPVTGQNNTGFNNTGFNATGYILPYFNGTGYNTGFNNSGYNYTGYNGTGNRVLFSGYNF